MGEQRNLTEENVDELKAHLERMQKSNSDLEYRFFKQDEEPQADAPDTITIVKEIREKLAVLNRKLDLIFDGHILINGTFQKIDVNKPFKLTGE